MRAAPSAPGHLRFQVSNQYVEVTLVVQYLVIVHRTVDADKHVHGLSHDDAAAAEASVVGGGSNRHIAAGIFFVALRDFVWVKARA